MLIKIAIFYVLMLLTEYIADDGACYVDTETHMRITMEVIGLMIFARLILQARSLLLGRSKTEFEFVYITEHEKEE